MDLSVPAAGGAAGVYLATLSLLEIAYTVAGRVLAARDGRTGLTKEEAKALGEQVVWQTSINFICLRFSQIDWPGLGAGIDEFFSDVGAYLRQAVDHQRRLWTRVWNVLRGRWQRTTIPAKTRQMLLVAERAEVRAQGLIESHSIMSAETAGDIRKQIARLVNLGEQRPLTSDEERELAALREWIATYHQRILADADPNPAHQPVPAMPQLFLPPSIAPWRSGIILVALIACILLAGAHWRIGRLKDENRVYAQNEKVWKGDIKTRDQRLNDLRGEIKTLGVQCQSETKAAADRRAAQEARARIADAKARKKLNEAASQAGVAQPFDLDSRLRALSETGDAEPPPAGAAPAEGVAGGVLREGPAEAATGPGGQ